jgi:hypothetical protein
MKTIPNKQFCGNETIYSGSGSDSEKALVPVPEPDHI